MQKKNDKNMSKEAKPCVVASAVGTHAVVVSETAVEALIISEDGSDGEPAEEAARTRRIFTPRLKLLYSKKKLI